MVRRTRLGTAAVYVSAHPHRNGASDPFCYVETEDALHLRGHTMTAPAAVAERPAPIAITPPPAAEQPPAGAPRGHATNRWLVLVLVCAAQFMVVLDATIVNVALPAIQTDRGFDTSNLQWVINGYTLLFGGFLLLGGRAADLFGRKKLFLIGITLLRLLSSAGSSPMVVRPSNTKRGFLTLASASRAAAVTPRPPPEATMIELLLMLSAGMLGDAVATETSVVRRPSACRPTSSVVPPFSSSPTIEIEGTP